MTERAPEPFETMRYEPGSPGGIVRLSAHCTRLARACHYLGIAFSPEAAHDLLLSTVADRPVPTRVRLLVTRAGELEVTTGAVPVESPEPVSVGLAFERCDERDPLRRHKTTARGLYDRATARAAELGLADIVFLNRQDAVAEGAISNVFVRRGDALVTPPLAAGALPGVLRGELIAGGRCVEADVSLAELEAGEFYLGSSLRGLRRAQVAPGLVSVADGR